MTEEVNRHFGRHLGRPHLTWVNDLFPFRVCRFDGKPYEGCSTYASVGLSQTPLQRPSGAKGAQEIVFIAQRIFHTSHIEDLLFVVGGDVLKRGTVLCAGEILGPAGPLIAGATVEALFCMPPPYFPEEFDQLPGPCPITIVGLIPITGMEAAYARSHGWSQLQELLYQEDPDIADLKRSSIAVCDG